MNRALRSMAMATVLAGLLAACSSSTPENSKPMSPEAAKAAAKAALRDLSLGSGLVRGPSGIVPQSAARVGLSAQVLGALEGLGIPMGQALEAGCTISVEPLPFTDDDQDLVPASATLKVDCTLDNAGGYSYTLKGSLKLEDNDDNFKNSGFRLAFEGFSDKATKGDYSIERSFEGSFALDSKDPALYKIDKGYNVLVKESRAGQTDTLAATFDASETYAPDDPSKPILAGDFTVDKNQPGSLVVSKNADSYRWNWFTDPTLHYTFSCTATTDEGVWIPFDDGAVVYTYNDSKGQSATLRIEFTGCGSYTVTLNGEVLE
ncbi:hypothetical protein [Calidithermus roseus]|uniref:Lipoprotein n=1 Tax=Calidithermus roseus TaxID=1644118 RepID=A0A399EK46_9DEIN|nr:hypothetical protein [Calidithermus roseus]RIH85027.1 hypothetical protein Mrose_02402 [Calidithermus roseus]